MFAFAMLMSLCVNVMVVSSAYVVSFTGSCGVGVSDVNMLQSVGDSVVSICFVHCSVSHSIFYLTASSG